MVNKILDLHTVIWNNSRYTMAKILIIDDEKDIRAILERKLAAEGHTVLCAASGGEGITVLQQESLDLVITDIVMPEMGGIEIVMNIRKTNPSIKIITITGKVRTDSTAFQTLIEQFNVECLIHKPFSLDQITKAVQDALKG